MYSLHGRSHLMSHDERLAILRVRDEARATVVYKDGLPRQRDCREFWIDANVQPVSGKEMATLPEGEQVGESLWLYAQGQPPLRIGDLIEREDFYQVRSLEEWGGYQKARAVRIDVGPDAAADFRFNPYGQVLP